MGNSKRVSGVLWHRIIKLIVNGKAYKTVVRLAMMYGVETCAVDKAQYNKLDVAEMDMLRLLDRIRIERIGGTSNVGEMSLKVQESRLKWYVLRKEE